jgi:6-phospho-beta-glucosidase
VLGGGSAYTPGLIAALIHHAEKVALREVRLFDQDAERLALVSALCDRMAQSAGVSFRVRACDSLEEAVAGIDVVLNSTRPGGLEARRLDETLPLEFGIPGQETVGPGGFFFALRSVPEALKVARAMRRGAPDGLLLNYTNPTNIVTQALSELGADGVRVIGLCDQSDEDLGALAQALGLPLEGFELRCSGLNHATWYSEPQFGGAPLRELPASLPAPEGWDEEHRLRFARSLELARRASGDGAIVWPNSYLPYYTHPDLFVAHSRQVGPRSDVIRAEIPGYYRHFAEEAKREHPRVRHHRGSAGFGDLAVHTLAALASDQGQRIVLNVPNRGATSQLSEDTVMEHPVHLSAKGLVRQPAPDCPAAFLPLLRRLETYQRLTAKVAAGPSSWAEAAQALAANPLVPSLAVAEAMLERARTLYGKTVPLFS